MDTTIRRDASLDEMKADECRYWQSGPAHERVAAVAELTEEGYRLKGSSRMLSDYAELLSILNAHHVKYLVVGIDAVAKGGFADGPHVSNPTASRPQGY